MILTVRSHLFNEAGHHAHVSYAMRMYIYAYMHIRVWHTWTYSEHIEPRHALQMFKRIRHLIFCTGQNTRGVTNPAVLAILYYCQSYTYDQSKLYSMMKGMHFLREARAETHMKNTIKLK